MRSPLLVFAALLSLGLAAPGCASPPPDAPAPVAPDTSATQTTEPAEEASPDANVGYGQCCKGDTCEGQRYESAHAFAQACANMGADKADWCPDSCELTAEPFACNCPE